jgi:hypothetical protein
MLPCEWGGAGNLSEALSPQAQDVLSQLSEHHLASASPYAAISSIFSVTHEEGQVVIAEVTQQRQLFLGACGHRSRGLF